MLRVAVDWGAPKFLNSTEYPEGTRPQFYHPTEFTDRHHFNPEHYNPPSKNNAIQRADVDWEPSPEKVPPGQPVGDPARPSVRWQQIEPPQPTLDLGLPTHFSSDPTMSQRLIDTYVELGKGNTYNELMPVDRAPAKLYRSLNLDLTHPEMTPVRRALFGDTPSGWASQGSPAGLFPESQVPIADPNLHTGLGPMILDHLSNTRDDHDLGIHWSTDEGVAKKFNSTFGGALNGRTTWPVLLHAEWMGRGEDPYRTDTGGNFPHEREITLMGGAPLRITDVRLQHPEHGGWHSVLDGAQQRYAALDPASLHSLDRDNYTRWRSALPPELADHYDGAGAEQERGDFMGHAYQRRSPWERPEDYSPYTGPSAMTTPRYPTPADRPHLDDHRFHFAPDEVNPPSTSPARPEPDWTPEHLDQDTLPGVDWPTSRSTTLYRGVNVDLRHHPELSHALDTDHPELAQRLLDHLQDRHGGTGTHWSVDPEVAQDYARGSGLPVVLSTSWKEVGEDPYRHNSYGNHPEAGEITLVPGADTPITSLSIHHPETGRWHSLALDSPQQRHAAFEDDEEEEEFFEDYEEEEEFDGSYCQSCGEGDSDWCEECGTCDYCDDWHDSHDPGAEPVHFRTPLYRNEKERPLSPEYLESGKRPYLFLPHEINPASAAPSRPYVDFDPDDDEDPVLFGQNLTYHNGQEIIPASTLGAELFRGLRVSLGDHPELAGLRRAIYGPELESFYAGTPNSVPRRTRYRPQVPHQPGMFPGVFSDRELTAPAADPDRLHDHLPALLEHLNTHSDHRGLGEHWSTNLSQTDGFSIPNSPLGMERGELPVRLFGRWRGQGEDPYRPHTGETNPGEFEDEREISLLPGAPLQLTDLQIFHPKTKQWHSMMDENTPALRVHAARGRR